MKTPCLFLLLLPIARICRADSRSAVALLTEATSRLEAGVGDVTWNKGRHLTLSFDSRLYFVYPEQGGFRARLLNISILNM